MKTRVAILGGGVAGLATAFELTELAGADAFDIHVYQMGWRLGGKCASSRNTEPGKGFRNEEHGLHVLGGFYHNTFNMLRRVFAEWETLDHSDTHGIDEAFLPLNGATLFDRSPRLFGRQGPWRKIAVDFPPANDRLAGVDPPEVTPTRIISEFVRWGRSYVPGLPGRLLEVARRELGFESLDAPALDRPDRDDYQARFDELIDACESCLDGTPDPGVDGLESMGAASGDAKGFFRLTDELISDTRRMLDEADREIEASGNATGQGDDGFESLPHSAPGSPVRPGGGITGEIIDHLIMIEEALVIARGLAFDRVPLRGFDSINDEETKDWLKRHGASQRVLDSIFIEFGYHYAFSYKDGDPDRPDIAAGATMRTFARMLLTYEGAFFRHFNGGIGEVLIKPFHDVLKARGVSFHFFHQVTELMPDTDGTRIERIALRRQAAIRNGGAYDPLIDGPGYRAWPHKPRFDQLETFPGQPALRGDFEDPGDIAPGEETVELKAGADFDIAVLAIPGSALKDICAPLAARDPAWQRMLDNNAACPTLSAQVWTMKTPGEMGWERGFPITTGHVLPLSTWADMSFHLHMEDRPEPYRSVALLCGPSLTMADEDAEAAVQAWIDTHIRDVLPGWDAATGPGAPVEIYARINRRPSELYNFAPAGSVKHRLRTDETGYTNLFLAGDWIKNNSDLGWVEGAVISALQCARAMTGVQVRIFGESDFG
jgi:uncharacterized protein with NAD-binding domain and iron-sulfur cluster